jgi:hypothetical protein
MAEKRISFMKHMIITKELVIDGYNTRNSKPVFCITTGEIFPSQKEAAKAFGVDNSTISNCCSGKCKTVKGKQLCLVSDMSSHIIDISNAMEKAHKAKEMNDEAIKKIALLEKKNQEYEAKMNLFKQCFNAFKED